EPLSTILPWGKKALEVENRGPGTATIDVLAWGCRAVVAVRRIVPLECPAVELGVRIPHAFVLHGLPGELRDAEVPLPLLIQIAVELADLVPRDRHSSG